MAVIVREVEKFVTIKDDGVEMVSEEQAIFDESSKLKTPTSQRSKAAQRFADMIRAEHGFDGYVILMSGTPSPKSPIDWWSQAEIAWPGFLREGSVKALEQRLAFMADKQFDAGVFKKRIGWEG